MVICAQVCKESKTKFNKHSNQAHRLSHHLSFFKSYNSGNHYLSPALYEQTYTTTKGPFCDDVKRSKVVANAVFAMTCRRK